MTDRTKKQLRNFLEFRWLRPEAAMFGALKSRAMDTITFDSPSLDISCGDGSLMFLHLGGEFEFEYDMYRETRANAFRHDRFIDIYDFDRAIATPIRREADQTLEFATDWKQALLNKASRLGVYDKLVLHDNNQLPLPFQSEQITTVFSTALYWVENLDKLLVDVHRILRPGGQIVMTTKTPLMLHTLDKLGPILSPNAVSILDRKRSETMPGGADAQAWEKIMTDAGFKVGRIESVFPAEFLMDIWNVGMRPISHLLIQMTETLTEERRLEIKAEWIEIFYEILLPLVSMPNTCPPERAPYLLIVATK